MLQNAREYAMKLFAENEQRILNMCRTRLFDKDSVEDCAQEVFAALLDALICGTEIEKPDVWLARVTINKATDLNRQTARDRKYLTPYDELLSMQEPEDRAASTALALEQREVDDATILARAAEILERLPEESRRMLHMYYHEGVSQKEIAARMGMTYANVRAKMSRMTREIKREVKKVSSE